MAIVDGKQGMQVGNMPSIDTVDTEGFIIYSDDGIHTYKMTIAEFAQAIGVVMTGGGDGDGGDGLTYWTEESRRIFRDIMNETEFRDKTIVVPDQSGSKLQTLAYVFSILQATQKGRATITNQYGYHATFGNAHAGGVNDDDWKMVVPTYTDKEGNTWSHATYPKDKYLEMVNAIATCRYPALNDSMEQPDSKYYCGLLNKNAILRQPYSQLNSQLTFNDIIINPLCKLNKPGQDDQGYFPQTPESNVELEWDRLGAYGQDRVYFGTIDLNVIHTYRAHNPRILDYDNTDGVVTPIVYKIEDLYDDSATVSSLLTAVADRMKEEPWSGAKEAKIGTAEYYFTLYCIGNPKTLGQAMLTPDEHTLEPTKEVNYYPWTLGRAYGFMHEYDAYYGGAHDTSQFADCNTNDVFNKPPTMNTPGGLDARYINNVCFKDQNTGFIFPSPYVRVTPCTSGDPGELSLIPEFYNGNNPFVYNDNWGSTDRKYKNAFQAENIGYFYDKADFGGAYFTDDDGTVWYILLTAATRDSNNLWYDAWATSRPEVQIDNVINTIPLEFDKVPTKLNIPIMDHWCMDGVYDSTEYDGLSSDGDGLYGIKVVEHQRTDPDTGETIIKYNGYVTHKLISLKHTVMQLAYERLQNIGKAVLNGLGLKGVEPLWPTDALGVHSEISATSQSALNGGIFKPHDVYEETYNLDVLNGSLYLKGDAYDNGKKLKDIYQEKLIPGENISITRNNDGDYVISSTGGGGGGGGETREIDYDYDAQNKKLTLTGMGENDLIITKKNGLYWTAENRAGDIELSPNFDFNSMYHSITGYQSTGDNNALTLDIKETYRNNTQRRLTGGKHVWINNTPNTNGNTPDGSGSGPNPTDVLSTDCIDTIKVNGTALTKYLDNLTGSYYVDIPIEGGGGGAAGNPFTITYPTASYSSIESSEYLSLNNLGSISIPSASTYDGYLWVQAEAAIQIAPSDVIEEGSVIILELRPSGYYNDIVSGSIPGFTNRSVLLTDTKQIIQSSAANIWTKVSVSGLIPYSGNSSTSLSVNVAHNCGLTKRIYWKAGRVYVPAAS